IFQDFGNRPWYHLQQYLDGIGEYVRDGGALAVVGGDQAFSASDFDGTAIADVLPAQLLPPTAPSVDETPAQAHLTDAGKRHPVTELVSGAAANETAWSRLPRLPGLNTLGAVRDGAQALLTAQDGRPILVVGEAGRGRTLALTTDASWYWSFVAAGQEQGPRAYETFWHSAIRWLVRDPALTPMRLTAERTTYEPGGDPPALGDRLDSLPFHDPERVEVGQRKTRPLWDKWGVLVALCCIAGTEWSLRRRWGYA